jgi:hypothetical protein
LLEEFFRGAAELSFDGFVVFFKEDDHVFLDCAMNAQ